MLVMHSTAHNTLASRFQTPSYVNRPRLDTLSQRADLTHKRRSDGCIQPTDGGTVGWRCAGSFDAETHWEAAESMQSDVSAIEIGLIGLNFDIDSKLGGFHVEAPRRG